MKILSAKNVPQALPMKECIDAMKRGFIALTSGNADVPLRSRVSIPTQDAVIRFMPAYVSDNIGNALSLKIGSLSSGNPQIGKAFIQAASIVLDPLTESPVFLLDGSSLTAIHTGAGCGAATDLLAREDSRLAATFVASAQGKTQLEAICTVRSIKQVWLYDPNRSRVGTFIEEMSIRPPIPSDIRVADSPNQT